MKNDNYKNKDLLNIIKSIFQNLEDRYVFFGQGLMFLIGQDQKALFLIYKIISLRNSLEDELIEKDIEIFSLEKDLKVKHINAPRNSNTLIKDSRTQKYIQEFKNKQPVFFVYKPFVSMQEITRKNKWILCANSHKFGKKTFLKTKFVFEIF